MAHFASIGLGSTLVPGVLWARMQDAGAQTVTLAMVTDALKLSGLELDEEDRKAMVEGGQPQPGAATRSCTRSTFPNDVSPPFHFSPVVPGMTVDKARQPFRISKPPALKRPANLEDVAFWPVRHLAELVRTRQVSSVELTEMYLARLHRYNAQAEQRRHLPRRLRPGRGEARRRRRSPPARYKGPLHGIPWGAKDIISVKGFKTTWGAAPFKEQQFDYDASVVEMLRDAGAVLIAKLATGELAGGRQLVRRPDQEPVGSDAGVERLVGGPLVGDRGRLRRHSRSAPRRADRS